MSLGINCCKGQLLYPPPPQPPAVAQKYKDPRHAFSWSSICADADLRSIGAGPGRRRQKLIRPVSRSRRTRDEAAGLPDPRRGWEAGLRRAAAGAREGSSRAALRPAGALVRAASLGAGRRLAGKLHPTSCSHVSNAAHREGGRGRSANAADPPGTSKEAKGGATLRSRVGPGSWPWRQRSSLGKQAVLSPREAEDPGEDSRGEVTGERRAQRAPRVPRRLRLQRPPGASDRRQGRRGRRRGVGGLRLAPAAPIARRPAVPCPASRAPRPCPPPQGPGSPPRGASVASRTWTATRPRGFGPPGPPGARAARRRRRPRRQAATPS